MVVGMDVYKETSQRNRSVAAFVASTNGNNPDKVICTQFYSKCQIEPRASEFSTGLQILMRGLIFLTH